MERELIGRALWVSKDGRKAKRGRSRARRGGKRKWDGAGSQRSEGGRESTGVLLPSAVDDVMEDRGRVSVTARAADVRGSREGVVER